MEAENQENVIDVVALRSEIEQNEEIIVNYLRTANNMKWLGTSTFFVAILFFIAGGTLSGSLCLFLSFLCLRKYNRSIGMAEIHNAVTKFLKFVLHREITGDTSLPGFLASTNQ